MRTLGRDAMRECDRRAIEEIAIPGLILMENAGRGACEVACEMLEGEARTVAIVCGKGNNGGDGFVVARHLHNRGHRPRILFLGALDAIPVGTDPHVMAGIYRRMRLWAEEVKSEDDLTVRAADLEDADLVVDAIFGTGLAGAVRGLPRAVIEAINAADRPVLAIDIPSGLDADTGEILGVAVRADETATFGAAKHGLVRGAGPETAGRVTVVEISIPREILEEA